jgi:hypothetical protein
MFNKFSLLVLALSILMLPIGCASVKKVSDAICNPTAEQKLTADAMLKALDAAQAAGVIFLPVLDVVKASDVLKTIRAGGCFFINELTQAFEVVDAANTGLIEKTNALKRVAKPSPVLLPAYQPLRQYVVK